MIGTVELREIRVLLTLAEERHFDRTARRLTLTPSRISQTLRTLETRVGGRLFDRASRTVTLTPLGEQLVRELRPAYQQLQQALDTAHQQATGIAGTLHLGMYTPVNGGPHLLEIVKPSPSQETTHSRAATASPSTTSPTTPWATSAPSPGR